MHGNCLRKIHGNFGNSWTWLDAGQIGAVVRAVIGELAEDDVKSR